MFWKGRCIWVFVAANICPLDCSCPMSILLSIYTGIDQPVHFQFKLFNSDLIAM